MNPNDYWQPFETEISSFSDLMDMIDRIMNECDEGNRKFAWRGQIDASWSLHSSLYRRAKITNNKNLKEKEISEIEDKILGELRKWGLHSSYATGRISSLNQLALLQHYGSPTRLIDISFNAFVAAFFATEERWVNGTLRQDTDARIFAIDVTDKIINDKPELIHWEDLMSLPWNINNKEIDQRLWTTSFYAWKPANLDARISAQNGGFIFGGVPATVKPDKKKIQFPKSSDSSKDGFWKIDEVRDSCSIALRPHSLGHKRGNTSPGACYTFRIKSNAVKPIRKKLESIFGYNHSVIYPDFTGFEKYGYENLKR